MGWSLLTVTIKGPITVHPNVVHLVSGAALDHYLWGVRVRPEAERHADDLGDVGRLDHLVARAGCDVRHRRVNESRADRECPYPVRFEFALSDCVNEITAALVAP